MRKHNGMRPQDVVLLLRLTLPGSGILQGKELAQALHLSPAEVSESLRRCQFSRLLQSGPRLRQVQPRALLEFLLYGLPYGTGIRILSPPYFVATKLTALRDRGWADLRLSQDLEDLVHVLDNRRALPEEIAVADDAVRHYIREQVTELLHHPDLLEALEWTLPYGSGYEQKFEIERRLHRLAAPY